MNDEDSKLGINSESFELIMDKAWTQPRDQDKSFVEIAQQAINNNQQLFISKARRTGDVIMSDFMKQSMEASDRAFKERSLKDQMQLKINNILYNEGIMNKHPRRTLKDKNYDYIHSNIISTFADVSTNHDSCKEGSD